MGLKSDLEWQYWGREDPLWGVLSIPGRERGTDNPWSDSEFYRDGAAEWQRLEARWRRYGLQRESCIEIGCGAGRLTAALAGEFGIVHAVDVSAGMLRYARKHVNAENVRFYKTSGTRLPLDDNSVTAAISLYVFQHLDPPSAAERYFAEIHRVLTSGGTLMVQLPVIELPFAGTRVADAFRLLLAALKRVGDLRAAVKRTLLRLGIRTATMRIAYFEAHELCSELGLLGFGAIEIVSAPDPRGVMYQYVFARKP